MTIRLQEVVRSEVEGGLSGPANPIPSQSIDCGCGQLPCPRLAKFATRKLFLGLMAWVGLMQAAAYAYFHVVGPTIARRFQFDPYIMEWIIVVSELTPFVLGLLVAYWGDRIHRAAWIGGLVLLQSAAFFILIIPHLTHNVKVIEKTDNVTHMSIYAEDNPDLCTPGSSKMILKEDQPCYFTLGVIVSVQVISGMASIAYYALGISYLDDNTKKRHVAAFIGVILAVKMMGVLLGYLLAWGCLRIDAETLVPVKSYREQIGAWWLGFPILSVFLVVPGLLLAWFPRMLPSEVVERAAASLLHSSGRYTSGVPRRMNSLKVGSTSFFSSLGRLFSNKILICNVLTFSLCAAALLNFMTYENIILESRFYVPKPTGMLLGFGDPMSSRLVSSMLKPVIIGLIVITSGLAIAKAKPSARFLTGYSIIMIILTGTIIVSLIYVTCKKAPIVGTDTKGSIYLLKYCNKNCGCSIDADFRPVCDNKGTFTFYSPCHAGCASANSNAEITTYSGCSCVEEMTGRGNTEATEGPCKSSACQISWLFFEFGTMLAYALIASTIVGDLLISLRSVYPQDKALSIGFLLTWLALIVHVPGKIVYKVIANLTCQYWGSQKSACHLHDSSKLGDYLYYLTTIILILCLFFKILVWIFSKNMRIYHQREDDAQTGRELQQLVQQPDSTASQPVEPTNNTTIEAEVINEAEPKATTSTTEVEENPRREEVTKETKEAPLKYGPVGPGNRRTDTKPTANQLSRPRRPRTRNFDSEDELDSSSEDEGKRKSSPKVAYRPLDIDSDVESNLSSVPPRSRKRVLSRDYDRYKNGDQDSARRSSSLKREFPNPDNYEDPRLSRDPKYKEQNGHLDGSSKTSSFEFSRKRKEKEKPKGDFNEVGIPIVDPRGGAASDSAGSNTRFMKDVKSLINRYEQNSGSETHDGDRISVKSAEEAGNRLENKHIPGIPLVAMVPNRHTSKGQSSSGLGSSMDTTDKAEGPRTDSRASNSPKESIKGSKGALCTDL